VGNKELTVALLQETSIDWNDVLFVANALSPSEVHSDIASCDTRMHAAKD
jgi:hypothetical protein